MKYYRPNPPNILKGIPNIVGNYKSTISSNAAMLQPNKRFF